MRASTVIHKSATRRSALRAWRAGAMIMGRRAVAGYAMAPIERRAPVQGFLMARAAPARGAPTKLWLGLLEPIASGTGYPHAATHLLTGLGNLHGSQRRGASGGGGRAGRDGCVRAFVASVGAKVLR